MGLSPISYVTANDVAHATGWAMHGWSHGDRLTNERFAPLETFGERFDELLRRARGLGFAAVDVWGAHLSTEWATEEHVRLAREAVDRHGLHVTSYAAWIGPDSAERACELARGLGSDLIGGGYTGDPEEIAPLLRAHGVRLALENHPERTPAEVLVRIEGAPDVLGSTVDTGWWGTQGYDPVRALQELGGHVLHVHLKDVAATGEPHVTCRWGEGIVDVEACVHALRRLGYAGALAVEHEPEDRDPAEECRAMREQLEGWLA